MDTLFIGQKIIRLAIVDSTNSYAITMLKDVKVLEGTMILADEQTHGRGQRGSTWQAEATANITCSLIITPTFLTANNHFLISKLIALAIFKALSHILPTSNYDIKIKWPNDILVNNKKIAGILIENIYRNNQLSYSVIGFGINVNQENFQELSEKACSIKTLTNTLFDKLTLLNKVAEHFEVLYLRLKQGKNEDIRENYLKHLLLFGETSVFKDLLTGKDLEGKITNVAFDGHLEIECTSGERKTFDMKEIGFWH